MTFSGDCSIYRRFIRYLRISNWTSLSRRVAHGWLWVKHWAAMCAAICWLKWIKAELRGG
jgi:hypothetical protein